MLFFFFYLFIYYCLLFLIVFDAIFMLLPLWFALFVLKKKILFILQFPEILRGFPCSQSGLWLKICWCGVLSLSHRTQHSTHYSSNTFLSSCVWSLTFWRSYKIKICGEFILFMWFFTIMLASHWCLDLGLDLSAFPKKYDKFATNSPKQLQVFTVRKESNQTPKSRFWFLVPKFLSLNYSRIWNMYYFYQTATSLQALLQQFTKVVSGVLVVLVQQCLCSAAEGVFIELRNLCAAPRRFD